MNKLTVEVVKKLAMDNYENGGDTIVECWSDKDIEDWISGEDARWLHNEESEEEFVPVERSMADLENLFRLRRDQLAAIGGTR